MKSTMVNLFVLAVLGLSLTSVTLVSAMDVLGLHLGEKSRRQRRRNRSLSTSAAQAPHPAKVLQQNPFRRRAMSRDKTAKKGKKLKKNGNDDCQVVGQFRWKNAEIKGNRVYIEAGGAAMNFTDSIPDFGAGDKVLVNTPLYSLKNLDEPIGIYVVVVDFLPLDASDNAYTVSYMMDPDENGKWTSSVHVRGTESAGVDPWNGGTGRFFGKYGFVQDGEIIFDDEGNIVAFGYDFLSCGDK